MKKILIISWNFFPKLGGAESVVLSQARYFVKKGFSIGVLTSTQDGLPADEILDGIQIMRRSIIDSNNRVADKEVKQSLNEVLESVEPDIVQFHNGCYPSGSSDMGAGVQNVLAMFSQIKSHGLPIIDYAHNAQLKNPEATKPLRGLPWNEIIMVSDYVKQRWVELGFSANRATVIHNGINFNKFADAKASEHLKTITNGCFSILFPSRIIRPSTGAFSKQKNFIMLLRACGYLIRSGVDNFKLLAILDDYNPKNDAHGYVIEKVNQNHLEDNIEFVPSTPYDCIPDYFKAVDVICVPSVKEAFSLTYIEAMAAGKVTIGTNTGGTPELIKNGKNGFMVEPDDEKGLSEILKKLKIDKGMYQQICENAQETAKKFTLERMSEEVLKVYQRYL